MAKSKGKAKFDPDILKQFFINHTEKIVLGVLALGFCYLLYEGYSLDTFPTKPADMSKSIKDADANILKGPKKMPSATYSIPDLSNQVSKALDGTRAKKLMLSPPAFKPLVISPVSPRKLREMPTVVAARNIIATPGQGAVTLNGKRVGKRWVVVTGLVPIGEQRTKYDEAFKGCAVEDSNRDRPRYAGFFVERVEVKPGSSAASDWDWSFGNAKFYDSAAVMNEISLQLGAPKGEMVDNQFVDSSLTFGLLPAIGHKFGAEVANPPEIQPSDRKAGAGDNAAQAQPRHEAPALHRFPTLDQAALELKTPTPSNLGETVAANTDESKYKLLRFFDTDVEPSKKYVYRVFVILANPNRGMDAKSLAKPAFGLDDYIGQIKAKEKFAGQNYSWVEVDELVAKWSAPSNIVAIPDDKGILAGKVGKPTRSAVEPAAELHVVYWLAESGERVINTITNVLRGKVIDLPPKAAGNGNVARTDFSTNDCVIDLRGGEEFGRGSNITSPGQLLVMDHDGTLRIHDELSDGETLAKYKGQPAPPPGIPDRTRPPRPPHGTPPSGTTVEDPDLKQK